MIDGMRVLQHLGSTQNVVLKVALGSDALVLRLTSPAHRSMAELDVELTLLAELGQVTRGIAVPRAFRSGRLIEAVQYQDRYYNAVLFPYVVGRHSVSPSFELSLRIGEVAAKLHAALVTLKEDYQLPIMRDIANPDKLIHGDFGAGNLLRTTESFVIIDFENACYSSYEYELGNSIYMMLFEHRRVLGRLKGMDYARGLLSGYQRHGTIDEEQVVAAIHARIARLRSWIHNPILAPTAVAASTREWKQELADFVEAYETGRFDDLLCQVSGSR